jgi:hypothetical protein
MSVLPAPSPTTELEAVNSILSTIGERPVNSLEDTTRHDVVQAKQALREASKITQLRGWWFNMEEEATWNPTVGNEILVPANVRKVDLHDKFTRKKYAFRGQKLYDLETRTYDQFTEPVVVDYVIELPYDELPESARLYIMRRAGVEFQGRVLGSTTLFEFTEQAAREAHAVLVQEDIDYLDLTLEDTPNAMEIIASHYS